MFILYLQGRNDLEEVVRCWAQRPQVMYRFNETEVARPTDFLSKFLEGHQ